MTNENVLKWRGPIKVQRRDLDLSETQYPTPVFLALIHIESRGDAKAISPSGNHFGLLQCGNGYVRDACEFAKHPIIPARDLLSHGGLSIWIVLNYLERYKARHNYDPLAMAALHKGGAGTANTLKKLVASGVPFMDALDQAGELRGVPNLRKYVELFGAALALYEGDKTAGGCA